MSYLDKEKMEVRNFTADKAKIVLIKNPTPMNRKKKKVKKISEKYQSSPKVPATKAKKKDPAVAATGNEPWNSPLFASRPDGPGKAGRAESPSSSRLPLISSSLDLPPPPPPPHSQGRNIHGAHGEHNLKRISERSPKHHRNRVLQQSSKILGENHARNHIPPRDGSHERISRSTSSVTSSISFSTELKPWSRHDLNQDASCSNDDNKVLGVGARTFAMTASLCLLGMSLCGAGLVSISYSMQSEDLHSPSAAFAACAIIISLFASCAYLTSFVASMNRDRNWLLAVIWAVVCILLGTTVILLLYLALELPEFSDEDDPDDEESNFSLVMTLTALLVLCLLYVANTLLMVAICKMAKSLSKAPGLKNKAKKREKADRGDRVPDFRPEYGHNRNHHRHKAPASRQQNDNLLNHKANHMKVHSKRF